MSRDPNVFSIIGFASTKTAMAASAITDAPAIELLTNPYQSIGV